MHITLTTNNTFNIKQGFHKLYINIETIQTTKVRIIVQNIKTYEVGKFFTFE